ncbi:uncharacterized protein LOC121872155 [Homarus americanus]|uniref:uncharacterized protein LOC121872155 n=1 Tax=Homarus americanus TaxID=6706 RepID=UPI001C458A02|nr:uncharacterized protein LOC121872155 [Homarus americanus]
MGSRWIRLLVVAVAVAAFGQVAAQEDMWPPLSESLVDAAEEWFGSPTERAAEGLPRLLMGDKLDDLQPTKAEEWTWIYLPSTNEKIVENKKCRDDVSSILKVFNTPSILSLLVLKQHFWPMLLPDSWGKMPDGVLYGNTQPWGMMEECTGLHVKELIPGVLHPLLNTTFNGKYCAIAYSSLNTSFEEEEDVRKQKTQMLWGQPPGVELYSPVDLPFAHYGTCMPSSCTEEDSQCS